MTDIAPDVNCPHCGMVIVCPHTMHYVKPNPARDERTDDRPANWHEMGFIARVEWRKAQRGGELATPAATSRPPTVAAAPGANRRYVEKAMDDELDKLAAATKGTQNTVLHAVACNIFEFVKAGYGTRHAAVAELTRIADAIGHDGDTPGTLRSAWNKVEARQVPS
jgi:hypothetical protein